MIWGVRNKLYWEAKPGKKIFNAGSQRGFAYYNFSNRRNLSVISALSAVKFFFIYSFNHIDIKNR